MRKPRRVPASIVFVGMFALAYLAVSAHRSARVSHGIAFVEAGELESLVRISPVPVLVEFWASWCAYCQELDAPLSRLARRYAGRLKVVRVDYDASLAARQAHTVTGLPLMLILNKGETLARRQGGMSEDELFDFAARALSGGEKSGGQSNCTLGPGALPICE